MLADYETVTAKRQVICTVTNHFRIVCH